MSLTSYINSNQEEIIELDIDYQELEAQQLTRGVVGNFTISFAQTINLDSNTDYDIGVQYVLYNNPYPSIEDSYFLYSNIVGESRVGSGVANILHKTLTSYATTLGENHGSYFFSKSMCDNTIIDWKRLNVKDFSTIDFIFKSSGGIQYPTGVLAVGGKPHVLRIKLVIRKSPTSRGITSSILGQQSF